MFFTKVILVMCGTSLLMGVLADASLSLLSRALGGFHIGARPSGWMVLFFLGWVSAFILGWIMVRILHLLPFR